MTTRPLSAILTELSAVMKALADQHVPPIPLTDELEMGDQALQCGIESQIFRSLEILMQVAHASGLREDLVLQQETAYREAIQVLHMSGRLLPIDL